MHDDLAIPDFLDRKRNGLTPDDPRGKKRADRSGIIWPKKRNWRKLETRRREREKREGAALFAGAFKARKGQ